jgi:hypothetical protein
MSGHDEEISGLDRHATIETEPIGWSWRYLPAIAEAAKQCFIASHQSSALEGLKPCSTSPETMKSLLPKAKSSKP